MKSPESSIRCRAGKSTSFDIDGAILFLKLMLKNDFFVFLPKICRLHRDIKITSKN